MHERVKDQMRKDDIFFIEKNKKPKVPKVPKVPNNIYFQDLCRPTYEKLDLEIRLFGLF